MIDDIIDVEVDGDFYHVNEVQGFTAKYAIQKRNIMNDQRRDSYMINHGIKVIRVWESEINNNLLNVVNNILKEIGNV